jgi:hypothetical protein
LAGIQFDYNVSFQKNMAGLRVRFGAPFTGLNSKAVLMLLTVPRRGPSEFLRCMSLLFHTIIVTLVWGPPGMVTVGFVGVPFIECRLSLLILFTSIIDVKVNSIAFIYLLL